ncbi:MAG: LPS-assembly protein LptD, partial [Verrucomicrobiota bacterium]
MKTYFFFYNFHSVKSRPLPIFLLPVILFIFIAVQPVALADSDINIEADRYDFDQESGWAQAEENVVISYRGMVLEADQARLNMQTKDVEASGDVYLYTLEGPDAPDVDREVFWHGEEITGNFEDKIFKTDEHKIISGEWYGRGGEMRQDADENIIFHNVTLSTCEYVIDEHEHYSLNAGKVVHTPDGKLKAYHTWYKVGPVPVFYWPYVQWDTDKDTGNIRLEPGHSSDWGAYLLTSRRWKLSDKTDTTMKLDYRSKRGFGIGNLTRRKTKNSRSEFLAYGLNDDEPPQTSPDYNRRFDIEDQPYRIAFSHFRQLTDKLSLRLNVDKLSDIDMLEEWFEDEYEDYRQPRSFIDLRYDSERYTASLQARARLNDFYTTVERLPELRVEMPRQPVFDLGNLHYEGNLSLANLKMRWRDFDKPRAGSLQYPEDYDALRLDSLNMFYTPFTLADKLTLTPRAGFRLTYYGDSTERPIYTDDIITMFQVDDPDLVSSNAAVTSYDSRGGSKTRLAAELGLEASTKFYRVWDDFKSDFWRIDGLRHVTQPYINYTYIPDPSEDRESLYYFDRVDRITEQNFIRAGLSQRLQTRHPSQDRIHELVSLDTYADFHVDDDGGKGADKFDALTSDVEINPKQNLSFDGSLIVNLDDGEINRGEIGTTVGKRDILQVGLSYLYRRDYQSYFLDSMGSTLTDYAGETLDALDFDKTHYSNLRFDFPIGSKMRGHARYEYDFDENELSRQVYQISRDLHCWVGALRVAHDNRRRDADTTISLVFYLKAFPDVGFNTGQARR